MSVTAADIRRLIRNQPFAPFILQMSNGQVYIIKHPEVVAVPAEDDAGSIIVYPAVGEWDIVNLDEVNTIQSLGDPPRLLEPQGRG